MEKYRKFIVAALGAVGSITAILWPGNTKAADIIAIILAAVSAWGVYQIPNAQAAFTSTRPATRPPSSRGGY
jgi:hypothetical protein